MNRPVRVLFFDHTAELGGGEIALADLVRWLDKRRVEPVILLGSAGPLQSRIAPTAPVLVLPMNAAVVRARRETVGWRSFANFASVFAYALRLRRLIRRLGPDIVHTNSLKAAVIGGITARLAGVPVIWHIRDRIAEDYLPAQAVHAVRLLARMVPKQVVANSAATLHTLRAPRIRSVIVPSGVDLSRFLAVPNAGAARAQGSQIAGIVGRICPWKGQHIFIEAAAMVHPLYPEARFRIIGSALFTDQPYEQEIVRKIRQYGLEGVIERTGFRADVERAIQELDIVVHASVLGEPFGQVIVQAMACKKPVIATNGGGVPEIITDSETGLLVPMGDARAMAQAMARLIADPAAAATMAENGYRRVLQCFTIEATAEKLMALYEELTATRSSGRAGDWPVQPEEGRQSRETS